MEIEGAENAARHWDKVRRKTDAELFPRDGTHFLFNLRRMPMHTDVVGDDVGFATRIVCRIARFRARAGDTRLGINDERIECHRATVKQRRCSEDGTRRIATRVRD